MLLRCRTIGNRIPSKELDLSVLNSVLFLPFVFFMIDEVVARPSWFICHQHKISMVSCNTIYSRFSRVKVMAGLGGGEVACRGLRDPGHCQLLEQHHRCHVLQGCATICELAHSRGIQTRKAWRVEGSRKLLCELLVLSLAPCSYATDNPSISITTCKSIKHLVHGQTLSFQELKLHTPMSLHLHLSMANPRLYLPRTLFYALVSGTLSCQDTTFRPPCITH